MAEEARRRTAPAGLIRRAVGRPYLLMAAIVLVLGAIWFTRLALQEFLLLDRLVNVYTNDAQIKMDAYPIKAGVTAEVQDVLVKEGERVEKEQVLARLVPDDLQAEMRRTEAVAEGIQQQMDELRLELPLALQQARNEVAKAQAVLETRQMGSRRAEVLLDVQRDRIGRMVREHDASLEAARANLREQEAAVRDAEANLQRMRSLASEGIVSQDRMDAAQTAAERARARLSATQEQVRQAREHYPGGDSPQMIRVHEKDMQRQQAEVKEQRTALEAARTNLQMVELREQRLKVLEARYKEAMAQVETARLRLAKTVIRSPVAGIVGQRNIEPGGLVRGDAANPPLFIIHDPQNRWVEANVWESDISRVRVGRRVEIWIDAFKTSTLGRGEPFRGQVVRMNPTTSSEISGLPPERFFTRREQKIPVKISLESPDPGWRAGMLAEVLIMVGEGAAAQEPRTK
ncbi:MAG: HlyD family secretion protein [Candidatus Tectomicrobia bacterium]|uniref:HlyD family secretion protein n=1 Tax=Tectimicrobiota bacterium TaxID=2528274 RepID=A0A937W0L0_UNCTE|nr:HlyD family secretion protein [Candidatus Tectomicrobia bacterium]